MTKKSFRITLDVLVLVHDLCYNKDVNEKLKVLNYFTYKKDIPKRFIFDGSAMCIRFRSLYDDMNKAALSCTLKNRAETHVHSFMPLEINADKNVWFNIGADGHFELVDKDLTKKNYCLAAHELTVFNYFAFLFYYEFWALMGHDEQQPLFVDCLAEVLDNSRDISYLFEIASKLNKQMFFKQSGLKGGYEHGR